MLIELPWPPTLNTYWRHVGRRVLISKAGRQYRKAVLAAVRAHPEAWKTKTGRLAVVVNCFAPDRRKRDLDNLPKAIFDSLTNAAVWLDDSQIDDMRIIRNKTTNPGLVMVRITTLENTKS